MKKRINIHNVLQSEVVVLGADEVPQIVDQIDLVANYLDKTPSPVLRDVAFTAGLASRDALAKAAIVATSPADLREKLDLLRRRIESGKITSFYTKGVYIGTERCRAPGRTVFLFPGEGSQYPDMLRDLSLHFPACRSAFDDADPASAMAGAPMAPSQWIFPSGEASAQSIAESLGMAAAVQSVVAADTGRAERVAAVWIDCGYRRRTVLRVAEIWRARTGRIVYGCQGFSNRNYAARSRSVEQRGRDADFRRDGAEVWFAQNSDLWRERFQRGWLADPASPGSLSLPGRDPREHLPFAEEVCGECLAEKISRGRGAADLYLWNQRPGVGNHYLDAGSGALCMAAWYRILDDVDALDATSASASASALRLRRVAPLAPRPDAAPASDPAMPPPAPALAPRPALQPRPAIPRLPPAVRVRPARMA